MCGDPVLGIWVPGVGPRSEECLADRGGGLGFGFGGLNPKPYKP